MQGCKKLITYVLFIVLAGCYVTKPIQPQQNITVDQIQADMQQSIKTDRQLANKANKLPAAVSSALLPPISSAPQPQDDSTKRFAVAANKMAARAFFMGLVEGTPYNMVLSPDIAGTITLNLKNVTIEETLEAVRDTYGYEFEKTSYGYQISSPKLQTQIFTVNYLDVKRTGKSFTEVTTGQISQIVGTYSASGNSSVTPQSAGTSAATTTPSSSSIDTRSEVNFWRDLSTSLKEIVGNQNGHSVVVNPQAGVIIVHALPAELHEVARYLDRIQSSLSRQVILEAKIIEVILNDEYQQGIDWNLFGKGLQDQVSGVTQDSTQTFTFTDTTLNIQNFDGMFALNVTGNFGALIKLLSLQGNVQVLSSPRISTVNNQKAVIKVGSDEFFVTGVSTSTVVTGASTVPTQDINLTPFFSGITLDVTPQISNDGGVILHIHPSVSLVKDQEKSIVLGSSATSSSGNNTFVLPLALSTIRESDNVVRAKNGQIIVIGGLMQNTMSEETANVPVLSKAPVIGQLFRRTHQQSNKTELVILLRPIITDKDKNVWAQELNKSQRNFKKLRRGFHAGGLPEVFGNEAEFQR